MSGPFPLADLPDDILVHVIARLPLVEQVRIGQVSSRFHRLMTRALRRVDKLTVMLETGHCRNDHWYWYSENLCPDLGRYIKLDGISKRERDALFGIRRIHKKSTLRFPSENQVNLDWLTSSMPSIRKLMFVQFGGNWNVNQVITLLNNWSPTLVSLTLLCDPNERSMTIQDSTRLFGSINLLARLQDLFLEFMHRFECARLDLPILGQVRRFHFFSADLSNELLLTSLRQYVPNNRTLRQILLGKDGREIPEADYLPEFIHLDRQIASKVSALFNREEMSQQDGPMIDLLCSKFTSLTYLKLNLVSQVYTSAQLVNALSSLNQLYYLDVDLSGATKMKIGAQAANRVSKATPVGPRLASVQVLVVNIGRSYNHRDLSHIYQWSYTFPSLRVAKVIDMEFRECALCHVQKHIHGQAIKAGFTKVVKRPRECIRRLTGTFARCPLIRRLMLKYQDSKDHYGYGIKHLI